MAFGKSQDGGVMEVCTLWMLSILCMNPHLNLFVFQIAMSNANSTYISSINFSLQYNFQISRKSDWDRSAVAMLFMT